MTSQEKRNEKKLLILLSVLLITNLCGCSLILNSIVEQDSVSTLKSWQFQHDESTKDYSVFFAFFNKNDKAIASDATVEIRIVDEAGNELYKATRTITNNDFGNYTSQLQGDQYLARIRIPESAIAEGVSTSGTVYLKIYKTNTFEFDEVNCKALYCLPVKPVTVTAEKLPFELVLKDYSGKTESKIVIEEVTYSFNSGLLSGLEISLAGTKTYGNDSSYDMFGYKLYDSQGYMVKSGSVSLSRLGIGDKFKGETITFYDAVPGEAYTIKFTENWY